MPTNNYEGHRAGFGTGIVFGLLGGLFAYFLYETEEGQDLKRKLQAELAQIKAVTPSIPVTSPVALSTPKKSGGFFNQFSQFFKPDNGQSDANLAKKKKAKPSRRFFSRHS